MRMMLFVLGLIVAWCGPANAVISCVDAGATEVHESSPADPRNISYTTPSGSNQITLVAVGYRSGGTKTGTTATIGGNAMSQVATAQYVNNIIGGNFFYIVNPPSGTNTVSVDWINGSPSQGNIIIWTCSGVDTLNPFRSTSTATGLSTAASTTLGTINVGDVAVDMVESDDGTSLTVGANQTEIHQGNAGGSAIGAASYQEGADGGVMSWTLGASDDWAMLAGALIPAAADNIGTEPIWFY